MKNSAEYSKKVNKLYRCLKSEYPKLKKLTYETVVQALVYAIISENLTERQTESALKRFDEYFVDLNDLRVSRAEEIVEQLGEDTPVTRDIAARLIRALRAIFNDYNSVSLESLKKMGKRPAKQILEKIDGTSRFVVNYCMLATLQAHAIPLTRKMIEYLRHNELVHPEADDQEIEGFLTKRISAANAYEFYSLLRRESESAKIGQKKATREKRVEPTRKTRMKRKK